MPHVCGDEPRISDCIGETISVCPTYVGMNRDLEQLSMDSLVCPTYVGMNPRRVAFFTIPYRMPHVCGDEPSLDNHIATFRLYAPRMWG